MGLTLMKIHRTATLYAAQDTEFPELVEECACLFLWASWPHAESNPELPGWLGMKQEPGIRSQATTATPCDKQAAARASVGKGHRVVDGSTCSCTGYLADAEVRASK